VAWRQPNRKPAEAEPPSGEGFMMQLSDGEKLILFMLTEICQHLDLKDGVDPKFVQEAISTGNAWGLRWKYPGIFDVSENSEGARNEVLDFLDMWSLIESGYDALSKPDKTRVEQEIGAVGRMATTFPGFDGNNEGAHLNVARFLIDHLDRYEQFKERELNSHMPSIEAYRRMYEVFEPMRRSLGVGGNLNAAQIIEILRARNT
jgi:uncharacterized protein